MPTRFSARRLLLALALPLALPLALVAAPGPASADDTYTPTLPTSCRVAVATERDRDRVVLEVAVSANGTEPVRGVVDITIGRAGSAKVVWRRSLQYDGIPLRVTGPRLPRGRFEATMAFAPDGGVYDGCRAATDLGSRPSGDPGHGPAGTLPDTGGPHLSLLLTGIGLLASGGALTRSRARARTV